MTTKKTNNDINLGEDFYNITITKEGFLTIPKAVLKKLGLTNASKAKLILREDRVELLANIHSLAKVYIEPTSKCNLACKTCIRNNWDEPMGEMDIKIFDRLVEQLKDFEDIQSVMFGGFGEPTYHKDILYMIGRIKSLGLKVEMVTNGTLLDEKFINGLIENRLDTLWVSFDGVNVDNFEDVRKGANFNQIVNSLRYLEKANKGSSHKIEVGIAFVVTKGNVNDLKKIPHLAWRVGAKKISVSNVLPYDKSMREQMLYEDIVSIDPMVYASVEPMINIPRIPINNITQEALCSLFKFNHNISLLNHRLNISTQTCKFIKERCTFIRWDGKVVPCMGLLHSYTTYIHDFERCIDAYILGDITAISLKDIWNSEEYLSFREKVDAFDFSPCHSCGGCDNLQSNKKDCFGNTFPVCGACLWAHGFIQCP